MRYSIRAERMLVVVEELLDEDSDDDIIKNEGFNLFWRNQHFENREKFSRFRWMFNSSRCLSIEETVSYWSYEMYIWGLVFNSLEEIQNLEVQHHTFTRVMRHFLWKWYSMMLRTWKIFRRLYLQLGSSLKMSYWSRNCFKKQLLYNVLFSV